jgi:hypothetical protein
MIPNYKKVIPIKNQSVCAIYNFAQGANILRCNVLFAIGRSIVALVI